VFERAGSAGHFQLNAEPRWFEGAGMGIAPVVDVGGLGERIFGGGRLGIFTV
jgi:hypothetical protein